MKKRLVFIFAVLLMPCPAYALPDYIREITVQGNFEIYVHTFTRLALIMSDDVYKGMFVSFIVAGFFIVMLRPASRTMFGRAGLDEWIRPMVALMIGCGIYVTFIAETSDIQIHDESNNQTTIVGDVPDGVVILAGLSKLIENTLIHLIETSGTPDGFVDNPGGITFNLYSKAFSSGPDMTGVGSQGAYLNTNLRTYLKDCFLFEMKRPGTTVTFDSIYQGSDFTNLYNQAANPAVFTVYRTLADPTGQPVTCRDAWNDLATELNAINDGSTANDTFWEARCGKAGMLHNIAGIAPSILEQCKNKAANLSQTILGANLTSSQIMRQILMISELYNVFQDPDVDSAIAVKASAKMGSRLMASGLVAGEWMPTIQAVTYAIFLGMMPFLLLFIATPISKKVILFLIGSFVFFITWNLTDANLHQAAADQALDIMKDVRNYRIGLKAFLMMEADSLKAYAYFGQFKMMSVMLASVFAGVITAIGGSVWTRTLSSPTQQIEQAGVHAEASVLEDRGHYQDRIADSLANTGFYSGRELFDQADIKRLQKESDFRWGEKALQEYGGDTRGPGMAAESLSNARFTGTRESVAHSLSLRNWADRHGFSETEAIQLMSDYNQSTRGGDALTRQALADRYGMSMDDMHEFEKAVNFEKGYLDTTAVGHYMDVVGGQATGFARSAELMKSLGTGLKERALDEIISTGSLGDNTQSAMKRMMSDDTGRAMLRSSNVFASNPYVSDMAEARTLGNFLRSNGHNVADGDLFQSKVNLDFYLDKDSNLRPTFLAVKKGSVITDESFRRSQEILTAGEARERYGPGAMAGTYTTFESSDGGFLASIHGESGKYFRHSDTLVSHTAGPDGYHVRYIDPGTGAIPHETASSGVESRFAITGDNPKIFSTNMGGELLKVVSGHGIQRGDYIDIKGRLDTGREVAFTYDANTGEFAGYTSTPRVRFQEGQIYSDLMEDRGRNAAYYDYNNPVESERLVQNLEQTIRNKYSDTEIDAEKVSAGASVIFGYHADRLDQDQINSVNSSLNWAIDSSRDDLTGLVNRQAAIEKLQWLTKSYEDIANAGSENRLPDTDPKTMAEFFKNNLPEFIKEDLIPRIEEKEREKAKNVPNDVRFVW